MLYLVLFFKLLIAHALCDFALQSDTMAKGKNRHTWPTPPPGQKFVACWPYWLTAHALIHAGGVWVATASPGCATAALVAHWLIDFVKCENVTSPHHDQFLHLLTNIGILAMVAFS